MQNGNSENHAHRLFAGSVLHIFVLVFLFGTAAVAESWYLSSFANSEIWEHLRVGNWILQNHKWPEVGLFSQAANAPWMDFSWGYALLSALTYKMLGLRAVPALLVGFRLALAIATFLLAGGSRNFWGSVVLSAVTQYVLAYLGPGSVCISVIFFACELYLLIQWRNSANPRALYLLPGLFFCWANLDLGFIYGISLYVLFLSVLAVERQGRAWHWRWPTRCTADLPMGVALFIGLACAVASLLNPYGYHAYFQFFANQTSAVNNYLPDYSAMSFHEPQNYVLMLLAMAACFGLGRQHNQDLFQIGVLFGCMALAFHARRDNWLLVLTAVACLGQMMRQYSQVKSQAPQWRPVAFTTSLVLVALVFALRVPRDPQILLEKVARQYPVHAAEFVRQHQLPVPFFSTYAWGSFLSWYLPEYPVEIDGRRGLYPEQEEMDYFKVMKADLPYQGFEPMKLAHTLLLDKVGVMGEALRGLPGFQVVYEDDVSILLLHPLSQ